MPTSLLTEKSWILADQSIHNLLAKIRLAGTNLGDYVEGKIFRGVVTGNNEAFVIDAKTRAALVAIDAKSDDVLKPFIIGRGIQRYVQPKISNYLIYAPWDFQLDAFPAIKNHLLGFEKELSARPEVVDKKHPWYSLSRYGPEFVDLLVKPKIIYNKFQVKSVFAFDVLGSFNNDATFAIAEADYYLLGCLNSKAVWFQIKHSIQQIRGGYQLMFNNFSNVTIPRATPAEQAPIIALVEQVLAAKAAGEPTATLEADIDALVAARYGLTPAEAAQLGA